MDWHRLESLTNTDTAINTTSAITEVNQTAGAVSLSLADGTDGQIKTIIAYRNW